MLSISHFEKILRLWPELKRFKLIPEIEMFSHSTPIIPRAHFRSRVKKFGDHLGSRLSRFWGSFGVGDHFGSCTGLRKHKKSASNKNPRKMNTVKY